MIILTLNLHTYQEPKQDEKFDEIVRAIDFYNPDFICFQECAQHKDSEFIQNSQIIRVDNMAHIICAKLQLKKKKYHYFWEWVHYGFDKWEEGLAILSKYPFIETDAKYISESQSKTYALITRMALFGAVEHPLFKTINIFCCHLSWRGVGLENQIVELDRFACAKKKMYNSEISIICGDFNDTPDGSGYNYFVKAGYTDAYFQANKDKLYAQTFDDGSRIDYIFYQKHRLSNINIVDSHIIFNNTDFSRVSDHYGVLAEFNQNIKNDNTNKSQ